MHVAQHRRSLGVDPVERQHRQPRWKSARRRTRSEAPIEQADSTASASPLVQITHQQHRVRQSSIRCQRLPEHRHEPVCLQAALNSVQTEMGGDDAQHPVANQQYRHRSRRAARTLKR